MGEVIAELLDGVFGWMATALPQDPFADYLLPRVGLSQGLGWLNWMFPIADCVTFFTLWIGTVSAYVAARRVVGGLLDVGTSIVKVV